MSQPDANASKSERFVNFTIERCKHDVSLAAALRRADNPDTEHQSWEHLTAFAELDQTSQRLPYVAIAAAIAKARVTQNGGVRIGRAIARCYDDDNQNDQARAKLRRLLACDRVEDVCRILRPMFSLIHEKSGVRLDYARLLKDLLSFNLDPQRTKSRWAMDFYRRVELEETP
jgi:CRISPR system Cascade subunit CasB